LLVPTLDSTRGQFVVNRFHSKKRPVLLVGSSGTAKTSTINMFFGTFDADVRMSKTITFSSVTKSANCQIAIEGSLDKRGGKTFGPPNGMKLTVFLDDLSMPEINEWGDQPTLEIVRQIMEFNGFAFLDKDKRGAIKLIEDVQYVSAMSTPGGGKNEIPQRLKRHFGIITMVLPSITAIDDIYGQMLRGRFSKIEFDNSTLAVVDGLTRATIELWRKVKSKLLPTPAKFHYVFNLRDLSRIFAGVLMTPKNTVINGGTMKAGQDGAQTLLGLWRHECERVFCDKLTNKKDKNWYTEFMKRHLESHFPAIADAIVEEEELYFVDFLKDDVYDEDGILEAVAPKIYEDGGPLESIRERVEMYMGRYNDAKPPSPLNLVLFDDALRHMLRISRIIETPRGSALLVGVGGSGKQSLTRLAAYVGRHKIFQITLTKSYNLQSLYEDIKELYVSAGKDRKNTTFLFTDSEIKDEMFLEAINNILMTGQIPGLFAKDEMIAMTGDLADDFMVERSHLDPTQLNLNAFFYDCVRDNLHMVICMSPKNPKFAPRARNFPGIISGCTIDWFLPWPEQALVAVSSALIGPFQIETTEETKQNLIDHMGFVHRCADQTCEEYYDKVRRSMYQTPKSYLSFIRSYKNMYNVRLTIIKKQRSNITLGLTKLVEGAKGVAEMKIILEKEQIKLDQATKDTEKMLSSLQVSSMEAKKEADSVDKIKKGCEADATRIAGEKALCEEDLAKAQPFVDEANNAIKSIKPGDIQEVKVLKKPADIIKLVFDLLLLLFIRPLNKVQPGIIKASKQEWPFIEPSWDCAKPLMGDSNFLKNLIKFGEVGKDLINEETVELMMPYVELEYFTPDVAGGASKAARGLCTFARAMKFYYEASKIVKPKLEALSIAAGELAEANRKLAEAEVRLAGCNELLQGLKEKFEKQMRAKQEIEEGAMKLKRKMNAASALIGGLAGEQIRWTEDQAEFGSKIDRLVGDCAVACAFTSYVGGFNQDFRASMVYKRFIPDLLKREVPVTEGIDVCEFMVDAATQGEWNMQGLPTDPLSIQNGVLVTNARRYPLMIDPQGQAISWLTEKEKERIPAFGIVQLDDPRLKEKLEFAMAEGGALIVAGVNEEIDPMLDPVLEKQIIRKGKTLFINVADQFLEYNPKFSLFFISRLPNPHFSPELQAKTTVIDFTVTMKGLEEQLLGRVISKEQSALEEQLTEVIATVTSNTKSLQLLDQQLLDRLTSNTGSLLDDPALIDVLAATKQKAAEVKVKLKEAGETREGINEKREQYRSVATRGSILYFAVVEMSLVSVMYQTSLAQFLEVFMDSMEQAEKATIASKRVGNIIRKMTYMVYRYINRGLYEVDKLTFIILTLMKIMVQAGTLTATDVNLYLRGGAALDSASERKCPIGWMPAPVWLNVLQLSKDLIFFRTLPDTIARNEAIWKRWYEEAEAEVTPIPDLEPDLDQDEKLGPWLRLLAVRSLRPDRTILATKNFINKAETIMGPDYTEPVTDTVENVYDQMVERVPVIYLLSVGADPTDAIETLAKKKKQTVQAVSLGEGQEVYAKKAITNGLLNGTWVLLQNCELGLDLMFKMEGLLKVWFADDAEITDGFRLFFTAAPHPEFPLGLLQMFTKVTNEPPTGLRAGLLRSYTVVVDQDRLDRVETSQWRQLVWCLCFTHSIVQERRKFGALGWCIPYEYNQGDLNSCLMFLEKHLYSGALSWPTLQYIVAEAQYGGKITDDLDRILFNTYADAWIQPNALSGGFKYNPSQPLAPIPNNFEYRNPDFTDVNKYREYAQQFPDIDSPEIFGLHPNADLTFRVKEVKAMMKTLTQTQPKQGGGGGGKSREEIVNEKAADLASKMPADFVVDEYEYQIKKLGGLGVPLNIFLYQEVQRLQKVIKRTREDLQSLQLAIKGEVVMTNALQNALNDIYDAKVPTTWAVTPGGDEFSWISPTLGLWFTILLERDAQNRTWLTKGRPPSYWLTGFSNPQGFLTSMKQEVARGHRSEQWALDDMEYVSTVTEHEHLNALGKKGPDEGVYGKFLFLVYYHFVVVEFFFSFRSLVD
jgi:dynein heavy chain, axonemal